MKISEQNGLIDVKSVDIFIHTKIGNDYIKPRFHRRKKGAIIG